MMSRTYLRVKVFRMEQMLSQSMHDPIKPLRNDAHWITALPYLSLRKHVKGLQGLGFYRPFCYTSS